MVSEAEAGMICAVTGLTETKPGQGLGAESESDLPLLEPVLTYRVALPEDCDVHKMLQCLRQLEERSLSFILSGMKPWEKFMYRLWDRCRWRY